MKNLTLEISQDEKFEFFEKFDRLSNLKKKIWKLTVWWAKRFPVANPCQQKVADRAGCSRKHVNETWGQFQEWGWLWLTSRGIKRSKIIGIPQHLLQLDVDKREYFKRIEVTTRVTHSYSSYRTFTSRGAGEILKVPKCVEKYGFSLEDGLKMAMVPESTLQEGLNIAKNLGCHGWRPDNEGGYLAGICLNLAEKQGHKLPWRSYYGTIETLRKCV